MYWKYWSFSFSISPSSEYSGLIFRIVWFDLFASPGTDHSSDHKPFIAKYRLKLKKVGKTTRPFWYDLNQIPYVYMEEVTNRFKGLGLVDRVSELWMEICNTVQVAVTETIPKKKCKMAKWLSERSYK